jgi:hypothetical protein
MSSRAGGLYDALWEELKDLLLQQNSPTQLRTFTAFRQWCSDANISLENGIFPSDRLADVEALFGGMVAINVLGDVTVASKIQQPLRRLSLCFSAGIYTPSSPFISARGIYGLEYWFRALSAFKSISKSRVLVVGTHYDIDVDTSSSREREREILALAQSYGIGNGLQVCEVGYRLC